MSIGQKLLVALVDADDGLSQYAKLRLSPKYFQGETEHDLFGFVDKHVRNHGSLPQRATLKEHGFAPLVKAEEPPSYYAERCRERFAHFRLKELLTVVEDDLNGDRALQALDRVLASATECRLEVERSRLIDFAADGYDLLISDYMAKRARTDGGIGLGYPTLDAFTGGLEGGDLISVIGRPGSGKTYVMLHAASYAWRHRYVPMFVSMEMTPKLIMQRLGAMMAKIPVTRLKHAELTDEYLKRMRKALASMKGLHPFHILDGALSATVDDVIMNARQLRPDVVFVDGAYLLRSQNSRLSRWEKVTENAERLKAELAEALSIPVVISYQFNREASKKKKKPDEVGLEDIAYTDAIGQLSSVVLGLLQDESVETLKRRRIDILKGRSGETGSFQIHWRFDAGPDYMLFEEIPDDKDDEDLKDI